ncbi:hypothetical protein [Streptomyces sp. DSM 40750]|uniref:hypothetical protein n=1 Tax=Streptomyces sp. DSM 40750 TaxID=2801030 RepID=UPI003FA7B5DE
MTVREGINGFGRIGRDHLRGALERVKKAGAREVPISAPCKGADVTVVMGVNEDAYDSALTQAHGDLVKALGRYDNEWGSSNRLPDLTGYVAERL